MTPSKPPQFGPWKLYVSSRGDYAWVCTFDEDFLMEDGFHCMIYHAPVSFIFWEGGNLEVLSDHNRDRYDLEEVTDGVT